ncbi:tRNA uridine-5-carboxymethylaminomethyl(34) synthesis GTPase MnmE [Chloroflexota bacterium]
MDDTIVAISTPIGEGGIGIVRLTGPEAAGILHRLFVPGSIPSSRHPGDQAEAFVLQPRTLHYGHVIDAAADERVDEVLAVHMPAPYTYTRQDVVEINGHGGFVALQRIQALCLRQGARLAERGEFTVRAFLNGRLDLAQAEAVLDIVQAKTETALHAAVGQLTGHLSDEVRSVRARLVDALAYLEASIDFVEDEIPERDIGPDLEQAIARLHHLLADADRGIIYRQGVRAAIIGRPNVGKSSLLNRLLRTSRAIVTDIPGTTRDTLEETLNLQGIPVVLVDTAGITARTEDPIERLGIDRSRKALAQADLALLVMDASQPLANADREIAALVGHKPAIVVLNKIDLLDLEACPEFERRNHPHCSVLDTLCLPISALTGKGLDRLEAAIVDQVLSGQVATSVAPMVTSPRHKEALNRALDHVDAAHIAHQDGQLVDLLAIDLAAAVNALGEITGQTASDDLLETIFGNFCVGK